MMGVAWRLVVVVVGEEGRGQPCPFNALSNRSPGQELKAKENKGVEQADLAPPDKSSPSNPGEREERDDCHTILGLRCSAVRHGIIPPSRRYFWAKMPAQMPLPRCPWLAAAQTPIMRLAISLPRVASP